LNATVSSLGYKGPNSIKSHDTWISAGQQIMLAMRLTKLKSKVFPVHAMNAYRGYRV